MKNDKDNVQLNAVEDHDGILTIRGGGPRRDWNGIHYKQGMSAKNVGTTKLSANIATIPPGGVAFAHIHVDFELILYIIQGRVRHEFGPGCKNILENEAGDFIYIKPGVPHEVFNMSDTDRLLLLWHGPQQKSGTILFLMIAIRKINKDFIKNECATLMPVPSKIFLLY
jgi:uncharacterized RmlC-like cupin family protein